MDWMIGLTPYTHNIELQAINSATANLHTLQFTVTPTSVLSLLQPPLSVSWQGILPQEL
jgi:hypothetical protein